MKKIEPLRKIPSNVMDYKEGEMPKIEIHNDGLQYEPSKGELVDVMYWVRYPDYDFIFGLPAKENVKAEKEVGFFQYRNKKTKKVWGFYLDCSEVEELATGFQRIISHSKIINPTLWQAHEKKADETMSVPFPVKENTQSE